MNGMTLQNCNEINSHQVDKQLSEHRYRTLRSSLDKCIVDLDKRYSYHNTPHRKRIYFRLISLKALHCNRASTNS